MADEERLPDASRLLALAYLALGVVGLVAGLAVIWS